MTKRSVFVGILGAVVLCSVTYFNRAVMHQSFIVGNYLPLSVYGTLIVVVVVINPLLARLRSSWRLSGRELAVAVTLVLAACGIAESGFLAGFTNIVMLPRHHVRMQPAWEDPETGTFSRMPAHMLADPGPQDEALDSFVQGRADDPGRFSLRGVPWLAWRGPLLTWLPLAALLIVGFTALGLVVHRQWSEHEKLPYPLAQFASGLLGRDSAGGGSVLGRPAFWVGTGIVLSIHMVNYAARWWPDFVIAIPTTFDLRPMMEVFPTLAKGAMTPELFYCQLYFSIVGLAYLVSRDVSFSFTVIPVLGAYAQGLLVVYGISFYGGGEHLAVIYTSLNMGCFVAFVAVVAWLGRRFYWSVFKRAIGLGAGKTLRSYEVWGARVFGLASAAATLLMAAYGLPWPFAVLFMLMICIFYVGVSRVVAETGLFMMKPAWVPHILLLGLFGGYALGPTAALLAMFLSAVFFAEARETIMPYMVNSFALLAREGEGRRLGRIAAWSVAAAGLGLGVGLVVTLGLQYAHGTDMVAGSWFTRVVSKYPFQLSGDLALRLKGQGLLAESDSLTTWQRMLAARPGTEFVVSFAIGAALVLGCYVGRLRIRGWPIVPSVLLLWSWWHCAKLTFSFFLGWAIKSAIARYGGWDMVRHMRPLMIGLVAGDMLGAFFPAIISAVYYGVTGERPPGYSIMP